MRISSIPGNKQRGYICEICGWGFAKERIARACEALGLPPIPYNEGDYITVRYSHYDEFEIITKGQRYSNIHPPYTFIKAEILKVGVSGRGDRWSETKRRVAHLTRYLCRFSHKQISHGATFRIWLPDHSTKIEAAVS